MRILGLKKMYHNIMIILKMIILKMKNHRKPQSLLLWVQFIINDVL